MRHPTPSVLIVEDSPSQGLMYQGFLRNEPYRVSQVTDGAGAMARLREAPPDAMLLDLQLPDMDGMDILRHVHEQRIPVAVVIITSHGSVDKAVDAMRFGAFDFLEKPVGQQRMLVTLRNALDHAAMSDLVNRIKEDFQRRTYHGFIGASLPMQAIYRIIDAAAPSRATVFITGESGTGKEVCAEAIHRQSDRRGAPFVAINCAAIPRDLMESEIFGHVKGAFTGAVRDRDGAARQADGGTLFLDEICDMPLDLQTKLLRFVQTGSFQPVGASVPQTVDVRILCATNRDPLAEVAAGRFREDLFYRLHVIPIDLPPLRQRPEDILDLASHFLSELSAAEGKRFHGFDPDVEQALLACDWPGNVRQLRNVIHSMVVLHDGDTVTRAMLPPALAELSGGRLPDPRPPRREGAPVVRPLREVEQEAIEQALAWFGDNVPRAAAALGVSPSTLYRKRQSRDGDRN